LEPFAPPSRVHHLAIKARNVERVAAFYREVLRLDERMRHHDDHGVRSIWLACGETILMIERSETGATDRKTSFSEDPPGLHLLALHIRAQDAAAWRAHLERAGHPIERATPYTIYALDPEGNRIGLSSYPEAANDG
jgi:glyoxylase I family protein